MSALVQFRITGEELGLEFIEAKGGLAKGTLRSIFNAWIAASVVDQRGAVWVRASKLHTILRTTKSNARYLVGQASRKDTVEIASSTLLGGIKPYETMVRSSKVCEWVSKFIQDPASTNRAKYLVYSETVFRKVRDCHLVKTVRAEFLDKLKSTCRGLKKKRIKRLGLKVDELTGDPLQSGAEFAHIRAASLHFELADRDWNGVVINKAIHKILTTAEVLDEISLLDQCSQRNWNTSWSNEFIRELRAYEATGIAA